MKILHLQRNMEESMLLWREVWNEFQMEYEWDTVYSWEELSRIKRLSDYSLIIVQTCKVEQEITKHLSHVKKKVLIVGSRRIAGIKYIPRINTANYIAEHIQNLH